MAKKRASQRSARASDEPEIIPPRKAREMTVRIDANYLRLLAGCTRAVVVKVAMPSFLKKLVRAARSGQLEAILEMPDCGKLDPLSCAEAICENLGTLGILARPNRQQKQDRWGGIMERLVIQCIWRDGAC